MSRPFRAHYSERHGTWSIRDEGNARIATDLDESLARFIVEACNSHEQLRRIVDTAWAVWSEGQCSPRTVEERVRFDALADAFVPYAEERENSTQSGQAELGKER